MTANPALLLETIEGATEAAKERGGLEGWTARLLFWILRRSVNRYPNEVWAALSRSAASEEEQAIFRENMRRWLAAMRKEGPT